MGNYYNDYGFSEINPTNITFDVPGIEDKTIGNSYTLQEEYRDWRRVVKQHITNEADRTIKTVNEFTNERVDMAENKIMQHVSDKTTYVINTLTPKIVSVDNKVNDVKSKQDEHTTLLNRILTAINNIRF